MKLTRKEWIPSAKVVKALNIINASLMVDPAAYLSEKQVPTMWIAGSTFSQIVYLIQYFR